MTPLPLPSPGWAGSKIVMISSTVRSRRESGATVGYSAASTTSSFAPEWSRM